VAEINYRVEWIENAEQFTAPEGEEPVRQFSEPLAGPMAALIDRLSRQHPALLIFDLDNPAIPWRKWAAMIKSVPATRRLPLVCFTGAVTGEVVTTARAAGADLVVERTQFLDNLAGIIQQYASLSDQLALQATCQEPLSPLARHGLELFNRGEYFEAHEVLETAWNEDPTPGRELYRAILQVAVAYLQIERGNYRGAVKMFWRVRQWIDPLPEVCRGVDVARLRQDAGQVYQRLVDGGPDGLAALRRQPFQPVIYT
jgi:hypothetical protein